jgi:hypothetical protein
MNIIHAVMIVVSAGVFMWILTEPGADNRNQTTEYRASTYDDTDNPEAGEVSGLILRTDHGTGCQYLETRKGGIVPRFKQGGTQICN